MATMTRFASEGFSELRRRFRRASLRKHVNVLDARHRAALATLGRTAWQSGVDLSAFPGLRDDIARLVNRAGDLAATTSRLNAERTEWQNKRQAEDARFDGLMRPVSAAQAEADTAVRNARSVLADRERVAREIEARVTRLAADIAKPPAAQSGSAPAVSSEALRAQHEAAVAEVAPAHAAREQAAADLAARNAKAKQLAEEAAKIQAERKAALQPIDIELKRLADETGRAGQETANVGREQDDQFGKLGAALREKRVNEPALAAAVQAVDALESERASTQTELDRSLQLTKAMPAGTMGLFWGVFLGIPLVAIGLFAYLHLGGGNAGVGGTVAGGSGAAEVGRPEAAAVTAARQSYGRWAAKEAASHPPQWTDPSRLAEVSTEEAAKDKDVEAYLQAPGDPQKRERAVQILHEDLSRLGSSARQRHLPMLMRIARGGEPELRGAATDAIGMIGPTGEADEVLLQVLNDPVPDVRESAVHALGQVRDRRDLAPLVRLAQLSVSKNGQQANTMAPEVEPDAKRAGIPSYPGAVYLYYVSNPGAGRLAYAVPGPLQTVLEFYAGKAGKEPLDADAFALAYLGATRGDPTAAKRLGDEVEAWYKEVMAAGRTGPDIQAEMVRRSAILENLPAFRYNDPGVYRGVKFVALEMETVKGEKRASRWAAIAEMPSLSKVLVEVHVPPIVGAAGK